MNKNYVKVEIQRPLIEVEICQGKCSQCWASKKVLVYRKPIKVTVEKHEVELGEKIFLCLDCLIKRYE